jgi:hypothetical protein
VYICLCRAIDAPVPRVFDLATDFAGSDRTISAITRVEMLTEGPVRIGTRFRETRAMFGREHSEVLEVTDLQTGHSVTLRSDFGGVAFASTFTFEPCEGGTLVTLEVVGKPLTLLARLTAPLAELMKSRIAALLEQDLEDLRVAAESGADRGSESAPS